MAARGEDMLVTTYRQLSRVRFADRYAPVRTDVPNGVNPGRGVHVGPNPAAREAANASVRAFLRQRLVPDATANREP
jgi:hypothetical protein